MSKSIVFNWATANFDYISEITLANVGAVPNAQGASLAAQVLTLQPANTSFPGVLLAADWNTFNNKQPAGSYITSLTTDVVAAGPGAAVATIQANVVTNAKLAQAATLTLKGNNTGGTANVLDLTVAQVKTMLNLANTNSGDVTLTAVGASPNANGASLSTQALTLQPADGTNPGVLTAGAQAIGGAKTFGTAPILSSLTASLPLKLDGSKNVLAAAIDLTGSEVTGSLPIGKGGTGQATKAAAFDALSPMTTIGDIVYGGASGTGTRLANGTTGQFLSANTGAAPSWATPTAGTTYAIATKTTTYLLTAADYLILASASGAAWTASLPTAVGITGKTFIIRKTDSTFNAITIDPNGSETIGGAATTTLNTQGESLTFISDGANWQIVERVIPEIEFSFTADGPWSGTVTTYTGFWQRVGNKCVIRCAASLTGAPGSGGFYFIIPTGLAIDTTHMLSTTAGDESLGRSVMLDNGNAYYGSAYYSNTTQVLIAYIRQADMVLKTVSNTLPFTFGSGDKVIAEFTVPIAGWNN